MKKRHKQILEGITTKVLNEAIDLGRDKLIQISPTIGAWQLEIKHSLSDGLWEFGASAFVWHSQKSTIFVCSQGWAKHRYIFWKTVYDKVLRLEKDGTFSQISNEDKRELPI